MQIDFSATLRMPKIDIAHKTRELKQYISQFETATFVINYYYALNTHTRTNSELLTLYSPLRQTLYLLSLFLSTEPSENKIFDLVTGDSKKIEKLLNEIEDGYRYNYTEDLSSNQLNEELIKNHLMVSNQTFLNYFVNGELNYIEQGVDKIEKTFTQFNSHILEKTGLYLQDYLDFYEITEFIDQRKLEQFLEKAHTPETHKIINDKPNKNISKDEFARLFEIIDNALNTLPIPIDLLYEFMPKEKVDKLLKFFSCHRYSLESDLSFIDECLLMQKPIVWISDKFVIMPCQKQLLQAIYNFLFDLSKSYKNNERKIYEKRELVHEEKTFDLFNDFFSGEAKIFKNYFVDNKEKDLLVLYKNVALIIECKANKYREPLADPEKGFSRIKRDFQHSIQKGYDQAIKVERLFKRTPSVEIKSNKGKLIEIINTNKYHFIFSIIVTTERFGQIQCDLGLLLKVNNDEKYPWSVGIEDLETFLITLKRKDNFYGELISYLTSREKLHKRLICFDELELASYFLMQKDIFIRNCNLNNSLFYSSPDVHLLFDRLYQTGLGFKNERNIERKVERLTGFEQAFHKALKLKTPEIIINYKKQQKSS